jgi:hypothetical protein
MAEKLRSLRPQSERKPDIALRNSRKNKWACSGRVTVWSGWLYTLTVGECVFVERDIRQNRCSNDLHGKRARQAEPASGEVPDSKILSVARFL